VFAQTPTLLGTDGIGNQIDAGGPTITPTLLGRGFVSGAVAYWGSIPLPTTFVASDRLQVTIASSLTTVCGEFSLLVKNPNGLVSNSFTIYVEPVLLTVAPPVPASGLAVGIIATGRGFLPSSRLELRLPSHLPMGLLTTYVSPTMLTGVIPADATMTSAQAALQVLDQNNRTFSRDLPLIIGTPPMLDSISPNGAVVDGHGFIMTATGSGFSPGASARWSGIPLVTSFVSSTQLRATVDASLLKRSVTPPRVGIAITIVNPDGGTSTPNYFFPVDPTPTISYVHPASVFTGAPALTLTVTGTGYYSGGSKVSLHGTVLETQFISETQLTATVPQSLLVHAMQAGVTVVNGADFMNGGVSSTVYGFSINPPALDTLTPASVKSGSPAFTMVANGTGFFVGHSLYWNGVPLPTQYVSPTRLSATVDAGRVAMAGSAIVTVVSPAGVASNGGTFSIDAQPPVISSLNPASVPAGGAAFTLKVSGANFVNDAVVRWNGTALPTSFVGSTELSATVPASLIAQAAAATVSVTTSGGLSNPLPFNVTAAIPTAASGGIVNAFSGQIDIAPGCLVTIYGSNLARQTAAADTFPLPASLAGTSVSINGKTAPLLYSSPNQVNLQAPFEIKPGVGTLVISVGSLQSASIPITVRETAPGTLRLPQSNRAVAVNALDWTLNSPDNPAIPGGYVTVYMTGQGQVDPSIGAGEAVPNAPFFVPVAQVEAKISGKPVDVGFAGLAPGFAGLLQVNLEVPDIGVGEHILDISIGGAPSNAAVLSIGQPRP
jgi:uncharacterized protein (TIGR03437 family)